MVDSLSCLRISVINGKSDGYEVPVSGWLFWLYMHAYYEYCLKWFETV